MYTAQQVRVSWCGAQSHNFAASNGVKQGAIISSILFGVCMDDLLNALRKSGVGCFIGSWFVGALAYAEDAVLI
jgi:hypothetical protein